ncbi:MAG: PD40 domain-containing protein [Ignavibacteriae bacterium]|nr:PD40 domain-containing protein [Ignavibacteriota bacterium]MCB9217670.1 PD40 domain-containing protein [Ignavibacteria bacterium]
MSCRSWRTISCHWGVFLVHVVMASSLTIASAVVSGCLAHSPPSPTALGNMGVNINSSQNEYAPVLRDSATLIFTTNRIEPEKTGLREALSPNHQAQLYLSMRLGLEWDTASHYELLLRQGSRTDVATITFPPTPNLLNALAYIAGCDNEEGGSGCDIFMIPTGDQEPISPGLGINSKGWDGHPFATADGTRLYFASDRPGGFGGTDIWFVERNESGLWGEPQNAGAPINTSGDELSPFLDSRTGDFYFAASTTRDSLDIFVFRARGERREALPPPYNSAAGEITPFITGGRLYLSSNRDGGCGGYDLYSFPLR